jgi:hypothetical protein
MGGSGGFPPNFLHFRFSYEYFKGESPVPPIASLLSFLPSFYFLKIMINNNIVIINININIIYKNNSNVIRMR